MLKTILKIYERRLERSILKGKIPRHVMVVADEDFLKERLKDFLNWCKRFGIEEVTVCVKSDKKDVKSTDLNGIKVNIVSGYSGRDEIVDAIRSLAELVREGRLKPEEVNEKDVEKFLKIKSSPDLIIKVGNTIPEFLIWQSIYSELYFADVNLRDFRYVDFLRCLRDYQRRERRYGR